MNILLFDSPKRACLYPLTLNRAVGDIRVGIFTIKERWERITNSPVFILTDPVLQDLYEIVPSGDTMFVDAMVQPGKDLLSRIYSLEKGECLVEDEVLVAGRQVISEVPLVEGIAELFENIKKGGGQKWLHHPWDIFKYNKECLLSDFAMLKGSNVGVNIYKSSTLINPSNIYIEEGAKVECAILNASIGPIYIGKNASVMEGSLIRGPFALCEGAIVKMGTKVYGATTVGPFSVIGGEVKNSVFFGYSNKGHDGYLGDSVIGEWCNMGAGTSNSNLKNTAGDVKAWSYRDQNFVSAGTKCGVIMGDFSRTSINTSINTGTVVGLCCNIFGTGLTPKYIPDFSWGLDNPQKYEFENALKDILNWKKMKNKILTEPEKKVLKHIFDNAFNKGSAYK
jgi:UDP-N-acetylglucosamine diphosphorylase / glucose-1-phosphate thymidylyltransferase / UDP-N-acetylgalactosamine diphosphorylase / glucosamine-1-phosphate N-acetyltransferase / galactosamine-1-phosphate N-acetyltransferase